MEQGHVEPSLCVAFHSTNADHTVQPITTENVSKKPLKRKILLSDKQLEVLQICREKDGNLCLHGHT